MISYYKRVLTDLFARLQVVHQSPQDNIEDVYYIQETLLDKIIYVESRIRRLNGLIRESKKSLATRLSKEQARSIKDAVRDYQERVLEYERLLYVLRSVGDGIAHTYLSKWDIKPLAFKETAGFISGKEGLRREREIFRGLHKVGIFAILNDLTNCLRYGDMIAMSKGKWLLIEVKMSSHSTRRVRRQASELDRILKYLQDDVSSGMVRGGYMLRRSPLHLNERHRRVEINHLVSVARKSGYAFSQVEDGLYYYVEVPYEDGRLQSAVGQIKGTPFVYALNLHKYDIPAYYPIALSLEEAEAIFDFYNDDLIILVFIDREVISNRLHERGFWVDFEEDDKEWLMKVGRSIPATNPEVEPGPMMVGRHFFGRVPHEFLSLDWICEEIALWAESPPVDLKLALVDEDGNS